MNEQLAAGETSLDAAIKILTIIKLLIQVALWGIVLGGTIYLLLHNPIPKLIAGLQNQLMQGFASGK